MTGTTTFNGRAIRTLRLAVNYTAGDLGTMVGLRPEVIRRLEASDTKILTIMTGQQLIDLAHALSTTVNDLMTSRQTRVEDLTDDAVRLLSLLHGQQREIKQTMLARSLGWNLGRLNEACYALNARLEQLGLSVRQTPRGWRLTLLGTHATHPSTRRLAAAQSEIHGLDRPTARVLHQVVYQPMPPNDQTGGHPPGAMRLSRLLALEHQGAITNADHRPEPSAALRYALDLP
jgi:transcriptional regulator with XRE-family HTH domain